MPLPGLLSGWSPKILQKLQALADGSSVKVQKGACCSLCGNGPVVLNGNQKIRKVNTNDKILKVLLVDDQENHPEMLKAQRILQSFELIEQAQTAASLRDFSTATEKLQQGIDLGMDQFSSSESCSLPKIEYLMEALNLQTQMLLRLPRKEDALVAAERSVNFVRSCVVEQSIEDDPLALSMLYTSFEMLQETLETVSKSSPISRKEMLARELETLNDCSHSRTCGLDVDATKQA